MRKSRFNEEETVEIVCEADRISVTKAAKKHKGSEPSNGETLWLDAMYIDELAACPE